MMGKRLAQRRLERELLGRREKLVISKLHQKPTTKIPMILSPTHRETTLMSPRGGVNRCDDQIKPFSQTLELTVLHWSDRWW
jgi:hypothetical protein